jgi:hypothetical protein
MEKRGKILLFCRLREMTSIYAFRHLYTDFAILFLTRFYTVHVPEMVI